MYRSCLFTSRLGSCSSIIRLYTNSNSKKLLEYLAAMPKENSLRIAGTQQHRKNLQKKAAKYGCSTVYLQVLGSGAPGVPNTLYLFTDQKRYLFNCGEGTQRLAHEHKVKLSRLDNIFITKKSWKNIGGLPGLSLTLQDVGVPNITLHGPEGLDELYSATKRFVIMKDMKVTMAQCNSSTSFSDNVMTVKYVLLSPPLEQKTELVSNKSPTPSKRIKTNKDLELFLNDETDYYNSNVKRKSPSKEMLERRKVSQSLRSHRQPADSTKLHQYTVAYICTLRKRLGTLDLEKCVSAGVTPGPELGLLKSGKDVTLPNGNIVRAVDVKTPDEPGPVFIVMEVPDISYLNQTSFVEHFEDGHNPAENIPDVIVHMTPHDVTKHPNYQEFISKFGSKTQHLFVNEHNKCLGSEAVHRTQYKLHLLDAEIFPLLKDEMPSVWVPANNLDNKSSPDRMMKLEQLKAKIANAQFQNMLNLESLASDAQPSEESTVKEKDDVSLNNMATARTLTTFHLRPKKFLDRSSEPKLHIQDYLQEPITTDGFYTSLVQCRHAIEKLREKRDKNEPEFPKVVFLGTGSCIPSKTRNTSAIVLQVDETKSMLLDCGEGTHGQLVRFYGPKHVDEFLRTLQVIYISHLHADHHIGLIGVLQARSQAFVNAQLVPNPVTLLAPGQIISWLTYYDNSFELIQKDFSLLANQSFVTASNKLLQGTPMSAAVLASVGLRSIQMCHVNHCPNAFGVALTLESGQKMTYSGDTIPCLALVDIGKDSTLLIHEATMEDALAPEARLKMHSTTTEAIEIGQKMGAKYTILTHFSQRYARLPRLNQHILNDNNSVGIAFDHMQVSMFNLQVLPQMYAPLQFMFAEHCLEMELKAENRKRQQKLTAQRISTDSPVSDELKDISSSS